MGVVQLLPQLKGAWRSVNLQESARGESVGIDSSVWLHALATRHAASIVLVGDFTSAVADFIHRSEWLLRCGMTPTFVFHGARLPAKDRTAESRAYGGQNLPRVALLVVAPGAFLRLGVAAQVEYEAKLEHGGEGLLIQEEASQYLPVYDAIASCYSSKH